MFISKVILQDFQSHSYSEFNLDKNLNVIVGISNQGKTSLVRALSLVLFNQWDKSWVRNGEKFCKITLITSEGITVTREKGEKTNKYILEFNNGMQQVYENFGTQIPEAIQKALRIHEVQIDSKDSINLNLSSQLEPLFLLSATNSMKAKVFGKLSGAHILDSAIREINRESRSFSTEKGIKEKELVELQGQVDKLAQIERFSIEVAEIEAKLASVVLQEGRLERIRGLFERTKAWKSAWQQETAKETVLNEFDQSDLPKLSENVDKFNRHYTISGLLSQWKINFNKQDKIKSLLMSISLDIIPYLVQKAELNKTLQDLSSRLTKNQDELVNKTKELEQVGKQYEEATQQYSDKLKEAGTCPICGVSTKDLSNV